MKKEVFCFTSDWIYKKIGEKETVKEAAALAQSFLTSRPYECPYWNVHFERRRGIIVIDFGSHTQFLEIRNVTEEEFENWMKGMN